MKQLEKWAELKRLVMVESTREMISKKIKANEVLGDVITSVACPPKQFY